MGRFTRNRDCFTLEDQEKLIDATVVIVGCGGNGGVVTELLVRSGIGNLVLIDGDKFEESNLNRQLGATVETIGEFKAEILKDRMLKINPHLNIKVFNEFLTKENYKEMFPDTPFILSDGCDGADNKKLIAEICEKENIPFASGGDGVYSCWSSSFKYPKVYSTKDMNFSEYQIFPSPTIVWINGGLQAQEVINLILDYEWHDHKSLVYFNMMNYAISVSEGYNNV